MRVLVEDFLRRGALRELETETRALGPAPEGAVRADVRGTFMKLGAELAVFYRAGSDFALQIGEETALLAGASVTFHAGGLRRLTVTKDDREILAHNYANPVNPPMEFDPTLAEEEDFDLGLFVSNVATKPERRRFLLGKWGS